MQVLAPIPSRADNRAELDNLISRLVDRPSSAALREGGESPRGRGSRPGSVLSAGQLSGEISEFALPTRPQSVSIATQTNFDGPDSPSVETPLPPPPPAPKVEILTYSKAVQTDPYIDSRSRSADGYSDSEDNASTTSRSNKRLSRRQREKEEEIRERLRREVEEELKAAKDLKEGSEVKSAGNLRYPLRTLNDDELHAVTSSGEFLDFVERSSKVIERALDEDYDVLADYELGGLADDDEDEEFANGGKREIKQIHQFWDERWSKKRMVSDICFSPKVSLVFYYFIRTGTEASLHSSLS